MGEREGGERRRGRETEVQGEREREEGERMDPYKQDGSIL